MKKRRPGRPDDPYITEASEALGVTRERAGQLKREGASIKEQRFLRARKTEKEIEILGIKADQLRGKFIEREAVEKFAASLAGSVKATISAWRLELPALCAGQNEADLEILFRDKTSSLLAGLREQISSL